MSCKLCVMCELASTDIMPVGKSLNKFGLLSKEIFHDLHKSNMNEGIKWRGLLHSINFQENKLARLALIELIRIDKPQIAEELEKPEYGGQISCICGLRTNGPRLKRSNSMSHIGDSSIGNANQAFSFEGSQINAFNGSFPRFGFPDGEKDDRWKYMSLQPLKSPIFPTPKTRRRSRSLEILRPFTALERETFIPKENYESSSESESMDDEIDYIFSGISALNKDYNDDDNDDLADKNESVRKGSEEEPRTHVDESEHLLVSEENLFPMSSGFPSTSSVDSVVRVTTEEERNSVFDDEHKNEQESQKHSVHDPKDASIGSPDMESTREEIDVMSENDVTVTSSHGIDEETFLRDQSERIVPFRHEPSYQDNRNKIGVEPQAVSTLQTSLPDKSSRNLLTRAAPTDQNYTVLLVFISLAVCLIAAGLYVLPESLISSIVVLIVLQLYTNRTR